MKIFLPFTINLDPYLMKLVKEEVQTLEASKPPDSSRFPPTAHSPYRPVRVSLQHHQAGLGNPVFLKNPAQWFFFGFFCFFVFF